MEFERPVRRPADGELCSLGFEFLNGAGERSGHAILCRDPKEQETMVRELLVDDGEGSETHLADGFSLWEAELRAGIKSGRQKRRN